MTMKCMIDLETLGLDRDAVFFEIGAVFFDDTQIILKSDIRIDVVDALCHGLTINPKTVEWWKDRERTGMKIPHTLRSGLTLLYSTMKEMGVTEVWANSPSFDLEKLKYAGNLLGIDAPWRYSMERDFRTIRKVYEKSRPPIAMREATHGAIDDAFDQTTALMKMLQALDEK